MQSRDNLKAATGGQTKRIKEGLLSNTLQKMSIAAIVSIPILICMAIYNEIGIVISRTRPAVSGTITDVVRNQGKHHVTLASVDFPTTDGSQITCHVKTWFRGADEGIYDGATIVVVPAISRCAAPWFPDYIPPPSEPLEIAAGAAVIAAGMFFYRRRRSIESERALISS